MPELRTCASCCLLVAAYALLGPGLLCTLFTAKASLFGFPVFDMEKSTIGAVHLLIDNNRWAPALIILLFSVLMPFVKLAVVMWYSVVQYRANRPDAALLGVSPKPMQATYAYFWLQRISKWATVDAFAAALMVGCFSGASIIEVNLHRGFYCFSGYCILSVAGTLAMPPPTNELDMERVGERTSNEKPQPYIAIVAAVVMAGVLLALCCVDLMSIEITMLKLSSEVSIKSCIIRMWSSGNRIAAFGVLALVVLLPLAQVFVTAFPAPGARTYNDVKPWIDEFAMLDVFGLAVFVVMLALSGLSDKLLGSLLTGGYMLIGLSGVYVVWTCSGRPLPLGSARKDKQTR